MEIYQNVCWWLASRGNLKADVDKLLALVNFSVMSFDELHSLLSQAEHLPFGENIMYRIMKALDIVTCSAAALNDQVSTKNMCMWVLAGHPYFGRQDCDNTSHEVIYPT